MTEIALTECATPSFGDRLAQLTRQRSRLCVGIDPHPFLLSQWGLSVDARGALEFSLRVVEALGEEIAVVKPQVAFYEAFGSAGISALERTHQALRDQGILILADAKRGDIGSTMDAYARAWLEDTSPLAADAVTLSPYLGFDSLGGAIDMAAHNGKGVFVLAATSNPEALAVQSHRGESGESLSQHIVDECAAVNAQLRAKGSQWGSVGVVVGATLGAENSSRPAPKLGNLAGPILLPGVGAQGAGEAEIKRLTCGVEDLAIPTVSRSILREGPEVGKLSHAVEAAVKQYAPKVLD